MYGTVKAIVSMAYSLLATMVPGVGKVPLHAILSAIDAVEAALTLELKADWRIHDRDAWGNMLTEVGQAAAMPTEKETKEAMYAVLVFITNIEEHMTLEQFMGATAGI